MQTVEQNKGRGRPKGTFSYAMVKTAEIAKLVKIKGFLPVSKRFLTSIGVDISSFEDFTGKVEATEVKNEVKPKAESKAIKPAPKKVEKKSEKPVKAKKTKEKTQTTEPQIQATLEA
jgi:hypothetical protein